jgi:hypothetical protein
MYSQLINACTPCQSTADQIVISDLDAETIQVYSGRRTYILTHERNANAVPLPYWYGSIVTGEGDRVQVLGMTAHYYPSPEAALAALREAFPEPEPCSGNQKVIAPVVQ